MGDNVSSAGNQQERLDAEWIVGFVDGEGCFHVAINRLEKMTLGWSVLPEFRVVQHKRDEQVLYRIQDYFGFGKVTVNHGDRKEFRVRGLKNLIRLIQFFRAHPLQTSKRKNFELFAEIISMIGLKRHLTKEGLDHIAQIISVMNRKPSIKYLESSETVRWEARRALKIQSDPCSDVRTTAETVVAACAQSSA